MARVRVRTRCQRACSSRLAQTTGAPATTSRPCTARNPPSKVTMTFWATVARAQGRPGNQTYSALPAGRAGGVCPVH
eukprot:5413625-Lingulodinium_polyedra.AAC.1